MRLFGCFSKECPESAMEQIQRIDHGPAPVVFGKGVAADQIPRIDQYVGLLAPDRGSEGSQIPEISVDIGRGGHAELPRAEKRKTENRKKKEELFHRG